MSKKSLANVHVCIDGYPGGQEYDEKEVPSPVDPRSTSRKELALARFKLWQPGQLLRIQFLDGTPALHRLVEGVARRWLEYANLRFEFGNFPDAEIRVTFIGPYYQSLVGTDALQSAPPAPTMMLGGFSEATDPIEFRRVTLHEFGHAIGCVHEQSSPSVNIPWDKEKTYEYYRRRAGWSKEKVDRNIFKRYGREEVDFTAHDPTSIMQYAVPSELTIGGFEIGWNTDLSETDKVFIASMYPHG